ncbi:MAG: phosphotransferase, partial [Anaerolineae bacterium]|nr:phosphotransferase [Anaerolineae bacterium]
YLVHGDYNFENVLHEGGELTGILDFEWAKAGDPAWDFKLHEQWEDDCPGCRAPLYAGYASVRPPDETHFVRAAWYRLLMHLDDRVENYPHSDAALPALLAALAAVEQAAGEA